MYVVGAKHHFVQQHILGEYNLPLPIPFAPYQRASMKAEGRASGYEDSVPIQRKRYRGWGFFGVSSPRPKRSASASGRTPFGRTHWETRFYTKCDDSLYMFSSFRGSLRPRNLFDVGGDDCSGASLFYSASAFIGEAHPKSIRSLRSQHFARSAPLSDFVSTGVPFLPPRYQKVYNDLSQMV